MFVSVVSVTVTLIVFDDEDDDPTSEVLLSDWKTNN
jgi:hypothetical protein